MKHFFVFLFLIFPVSALAAASIIAEPKNQLAVIPIKHPAEYQHIYGELNNHPHIFEFVAPEAMRLYAEVSIPKGSAFKKSLIAIREEKRGVSEVGRVSHDGGVWEKERDWSLGRSFETQGAIDTEIAPGVYRIEVSSPKNLGKYKLVIGTDQNRRGYFGKLSDAMLGAKFFGSSPVAILRAPIVCLSLAAVILLLYGTRRYFFLKHV